VSLLLGQLIRLHGLRLMASSLGLGSKDSSVPGGVEWVALWQGAVNQIFGNVGFGSYIKVDGVFGSFTEQATCEVQAMYGLDTTGVVDNLLWSETWADFNYGG